MNKWYGKYTHGASIDPADAAKKTFFSILSGNIDPGPGPAPDPGPGPDPGPTPDPPTPAPGFHPWLIDPGDAILSMGYFINRWYTNGISRWMDRGPYPNMQYNLPAGSVLPNCTGYAYGRIMIMLGINTVPTSGQIPVSGNAAQWYRYTSWPKSQVPTMGSVMCWDNGNLGHVAIVEYVHWTTYPNWDYLILSESGYGNRWYTGSPELKSYQRPWDFGGCCNSTITYTNRHRFTGYQLQGFINVPVS